MHSRNFPESRKVLLLLGDICLQALAYMAATAICWHSPVFSTSLTLYLTYYNGMLPLIWVLTALIFNINGLYSIGRKRFAEIILSVGVSLFSVFVLVMFISLPVAAFDGLRFAIFLSTVISFLLLTLWRRFMWQVEHEIHSSQRVIIIGPEEQCIHIYRRMSQQPQLRYRLKYVCTDMSQANWQRAIDDVDVVIVCPDIQHRNKSAILQYCLDKGKQAMLLPDTYAVLCSCVDLDKIDDIPLLTPRDFAPSVEVRSLKRLLDLVVAAIGFVCALPFMLGTAIAIKIWDLGPILYSQIRTGKNGREFRVYKFRTMRVDAEKYSGPQLSTENDPRITKLGRFLRAVRLDELPQIWNVLNGDMSIVGPRPERPFFVEQFQREIPAYKYRHNVKPGITGLAQVYGKYNTTPYDKLVYDLLYIQRCGIMLDLSIIIQTVKVLFTKSATEGVGYDQRDIDLSEIDVSKSNIYGDF